MTKYAVYVVIVEDTEDNDVSVLTSGPVEEGERVRGGMGFTEAEAIVRDIAQDYLP